MNIVSTVCKMWKKHGALILTIGSCVGVGATAYFTGKAVLEADKVLKDIPDEELKTFETKKKLAKIYWKPVVAGAVTIACNIGGYAMNKKAQAGLIAAYSLLYSRFSKYREEVGPDCDVLAMKDVDNRIIREASNDIFEEEHEEDECLWIDDFHEKPYWAKESDIWRGLHYLNKEIFEPTWHKGYATLNEFYGIANVPMVNGGDSLGWSMDYLINAWDCYIMEFDWGDTEVNMTNPKTGLPCKVKRLYFGYDPVPDYLDKKYWCC